MFLIEFSYFSNETNLKLISVFKPARCTYESLYWLLRVVLRQWYFILKLCRESTNIYMKSMSSYSTCAKCHVNRMETLYHMIFQKMIQKVHRKLHWEPANEYENCPQKKARNHKWRKKTKLMWFCPLAVNRVTLHCKA